MSIKKKVIAGLRCCIVRNPDDNMRCPECPYRDPGTYCLNRLKIDALAVLEADEEEPVCDACMIHFDEEQEGAGREFHTNVQPREGIVEATRRQLEKEQITGKLIHLCFTCDPYPTGYDTRPTREIIKLLKEYGNHVQILTKGCGIRDFDLLDGEDWYGVTIDCKHEPSMYFSKINTLSEAKQRGINTWVSFEPVLDSQNCLDFLTIFHGVIDKAKIGKLNYHPSDINWKSFGHEAERLCRQLGLDYTIKDSLRAEMERA